MVTDEYVSIIPGVTLLVSTRFQHSEYLMCTEKQADVNGSYFKETERRWGDYVLKENIMYLIVLFLLSCNALETL